MSVNTNNLILVDPSTLTAGQRIVRIGDLLFPVGVASTDAAIEISYGYINSDGKVQLVDVSGDAPVDTGDPIEVTVKMFNTGQAEPDYAG